jgi:hypothetical protein
MKDFRHAVELRNSRKIATTVLAVISSAVAAAEPHSSASYSVNAGQSSVEIHVYREGLLKTFGHDHLISAKQLSGNVELVRNCFGCNKLRALLKHDHSA